MQGTASRLIKLAMLAGCRTRSTPGRVTPWSYGCLTSWCWRCPRPGKLDWVRAEVPARMAGRGRAEVPLLAEVGVSTAGVSGARARRGRGTRARSRSDVLGPKMAPFRTDQTFGTGMTAARLPATPCCACRVTAGGRAGCAGSHRLGGHSRRLREFIVPVQRRDGTGRRKPTERLCCAARRGRAGAQPRLRAFPAQAGQEELYVDTFIPGKIVDWGSHVDPMGSAVGQLEITTAITRVPAGSQ